MSPYKGAPNVRSSVNNEPEHCIGYIPKWRKLQLAHQCYCEACWISNRHSSALTIVMSLLHFVFLCVGCSGRSMQRCPSCRLVRATGALGTANASWRYSCRGIVAFRAHDLELVQYCAFLVSVLRRTASPIDADVAYANSPPPPPLRKDSGAPFSTIASRSAMLLILISTYNVPGACAHIQCVQVSDGLRRTALSQRCMCPSAVEPVASHRK